MKNFTRLTILLLGIFVTAVITDARSQIQFEGLVSQGEGTAGWNADGSGPEPAASGHITPFGGVQAYYGASQDYITGDADHAGFHLLAGMTGFPQFEQALADHGYTPEQVQCKLDLCNLGDDIEGEDWFHIGTYHYSNYYAIDFYFELDGEPMLHGSFDYSTFSDYLGGSGWINESGFAPAHDNSMNSCEAVQAVAQAFFNDLDGREIKISYSQTFDGYLTGNGRNGGFYNILDGLLEAGYPEIPFQGLAADHEGFAGWDADGSGPEPYGNGHETQMYYCASRDYDDIDPDPGACLGHFLEGSNGFINTLLQLEYRGYDIGDMKIKMGLISLGPDVYGEDWGYVNGHHWCNYYLNAFTLELAGEPILAFMLDTTCLQYITTHWISDGTYGRVYDISGGASAEAQYVAMSFMKDAGSHYLELLCQEIHYVSGSSFTGNGRDGAMWEITQGSMRGKCSQATFLAGGDVSGTWTLDASPYFVDSSLTVAEDDELIIEPGVQVLVRGPYRVEVRGRVVAEGNSGEMIAFNRSNPRVKWTGFYLHDQPEEADSTLFSWCSFEHGFTNEWQPLANNSGGAIKMYYFDKMRISHCIFRNNEAFAPGGGYYPSGGAIATWDCSPLIEYCTFDNNHSEYGGAINLAFNSNATVRHCTFSNDTATFRGGAIIVYYEASPVIENNHFYNNYADDGGGAISVEIESQPVIKYNLFHDNFAGSRGGAISLIDGSVPQISNNTIVFNEVDTSNANGLGGGIAISGNVKVSLNENILWGNMTTDAHAFGQQVSLLSPDTLECYYNDIGGGMEGIGPGTLVMAYENNIDRNPEFCEPEDTLFTLFGTSPCATAGPAGNYIGALDVGCWVAIPEPGTDESAFTLYPNPLQGESVNLSLQMDHPGVVTLTIYTILGEKVSEPIQHYIPAGNHLLVADLSDLPTGTYICRLTRNGEVHTSKLVKFR